MILRDTRIEKVKERARRIIAEHPEWINESTFHKPDRQYVEIGRHRVYFSRNGSEIEMSDRDIYRWKLWGRVLTRV